MENGRSRLWTCLALCVIIGLAAAGLADAGLFGRGKKPATGKTGPGVSKSLVIFPFDQADVSRVPEAFGEYVASDLRTMLGSGSDYAVYLYRDRLSPIVRAWKNDNTLKTTDVAPPFAEDREKALKLAKILASDYFLIGTIDDCSVDSKSKTAVLTLSAELVDAKTGRLIKTLLVTGRSPESAKTSFEDELRDIAKGDAVTKLMAEIVAQPKAEPGVVPEPSTAPAPADGGKAQPANEPEKKAPVAE